MANILVLNGPNLNLLGKREPQHYGTTTLATIHSDLTQCANELGHTLTAFQSNAEFELINRIQECLTDSTDFIIMNPAAFTHTSIALRDALCAVNKPLIEVHLSNIYARESFRHHSYFSDIALGVITGFGAEGYKMALNYAHHHLKNLT